VAGDVAAAGQDERRALAERLADYFRLQLLLAEAVAARTGEPLAGALTRLTNLMRRLRLDEGGAWPGFAARLAELPTTASRLALVLDAFVAAPPDPFGKPPFGCFGHDPPDADGVVRIHFPGGDSDDGSGPLARHKMGRRRAELAAMVASIRARHPDATAVRGGSWLYNLEAYRRLFPPAFVESRSSPGAWRLAGTSTWGQMIDHAGRLRPASRDFFMARLQSVDPAAPWEVFPLRALATRAPLQVFVDFYATSDQHG
jgi:hypothetical protein